MENHTPTLTSDDQGLLLTDGEVTVRGDFTRMLNRIAPGNLPHELLVKATRLKGGPEHPIAIDATAGLGEDALILAAAGFGVTLYERNPTIAALLEDALNRARAVPELAEAIARMHLVKANSIEALPHLDMQPDVVLLDPMFPAKSKSALAKKKLHMLQQIEQPCDDEEQLLKAAITAKPRKIIIKRPIKGPHLAGRKPSYSLEGKAIRYDCIVLARN